MITQKIALGLVKIFTIKYKKNPGFKKNDCNGAYALSAVVFTSF